MYQRGTTAKNVIMQPAPAGDVDGDGRRSRSTALDQNYQQAGLRVWTDDDNWASVHMISAGGNRVTSSSSSRTTATRGTRAADKLGGIPADSPLTYYVRLHLGRDER